MKWKMRNCVVFLFFRLLFKIVFSSLSLALKNDSANLSRHLSCFGFLLLPLFCRSSLRALSSLSLTRSVVAFVVYFWRTMSCEQLVAVLFIVKQPPATTTTIITKTTCAKLNLLVRLFHLLSSGRRCCWILWNFLCHWMETKKKMCKYKARERERESAQDGASILIICHISSSYSYRLSVGSINISYLLLSHIIKIT